jgi:iron complex transport system substrate-binding protein
MGVSSKVTVDSCGKPVTFEAAPKRAVIQDINMSEMAFALHLQSSMVGVSGITGWYKLDDAFKKQLGAIPELAPKYPTLENLIAAEPDFFFAGWNYGMKPGGEVTPDTLAPHGIKTLELTESCIHLDKSRPAATMDLLYGDMEKLGKIFDREDEANKLVSGWKAELAAIKTKIGDKSGTRVFLYDSGEDKHSDGNDQRSRRHQYHGRSRHQLGRHLVGNRGDAQSGIPRSPRLSG